jgi:hypothetical protein
VRSACALIPYHGARRPSRAPRARPPALPHHAPYNARSEAEIRRNLDNESKVEYDNLCDGAFVYIAHIKARRNALLSDKTFRAFRQRVTSALVLSEFVYHEDAGAGGDGEDGTDDAETRRGVVGDGPKKKARLGGASSSSSSSTPKPQNPKYLTNID